MADPYAPIRFRMRPVAFRLIVALAYTAAFLAWAHLYWLSGVVLRVVESVFRWGLVHVDEHGRRVKRAFSRQTPETSRGPR